MPLEAGRLDVVTGCGARRRCRPASPLALGALALLAAAASAQTIHVDAAKDHAVQSFVPNAALGAGIDRISTRATDTLFSPAVRDRVLTAGWRTVSYRQNTELHVEAWHWNPEGTWSDPAGRGYFTGSAVPGAPIRHSFGYSLPHRGFTRNDGTERGYSRLTDGDLDSYWKSNPYLTRRFTGEDDHLHPQWVTLDLATAHPVSALRIAWADPYARRYRVQYWTGQDPIRQPTHGTWVTFPGGEVDDGTGGTTTLRLAPAPLPVRFLRIWMTESSDSCDTHGPSDPRNCVGYAIRELFLGTLSGDDSLHDLVRHVPDPDQTATLCSSVDPWHEPTDVNEARDQVGMDLFYTSGYTRGLPAMIAVAMLYGTPEDSAAEIAYLEARGYPISWIEMGEEPDGQYMLPEDYGALYLQWATALHRVDPALKLGGPVFEGVNEDILVWPDEQGRASWLGRFVDYLKSHGRLGDLSFVSFEHYPYEPCAIQWSSLYAEPALIRHILEVWRDDGVPPDVPLLITEVNIAWNTSEAFVDTFGALWLADFVGAFLEAGGGGLYYFHYLPVGLYRGCHGSMGTFGLFTVDKEYRIEQPTSQYFASQLITLEWVEPGDRPHEVYPARGDVQDAAGHALVTAYALRRPDGQWALLLVNKDQENAHAVRIVFDDGASGGRTFSGKVDLVTFGSAQYQWHPDATGGRAEPDGPAARSSLTADAGTLYTLPPASISVIRGRLGDTRD
jgi:hypothetical protein